jgi:hypothetical protein
MHLKSLVENVEALFAVMGLYIAVARKHILAKRTKPVPSKPPSVDEITRLELPGDGAVIVAQDKSGKPTKAMYRPGKTGPATTADVVRIERKHAGADPVVILRHPGQAPFRRRLYSRFLLAA